MLVSGDVLCAHVCVHTCEGLVYLSVNQSISTGVDNTCGEKATPQINTSKEAWGKGRDGWPQGTQRRIRSCLPKGLREWRAALEPSLLLFLPLSLSPVEHLGNSVCLFKWLTYKQMKLTRLVFFNEGKHAQY